jgi:hypothetical protein
MAKVIFTPNIQRHVLCPEAEAPDRPRNRRRFAEAPPFPPGRSQPMEFLNSF